MKNIDLEFIRTYIAVVETGSLTLAAKSRGKKTGTLSYHIIQLETALGHKLFVRDGRGMKISEYGRQFLPEARFLLETHDQICDRKKTVSSAAPEKISLQNIVRARVPVSNSPIREIIHFKNNLETKLLKNIFSIWQSSRADGKDLSLDDIISHGILSLSQHTVLLMDVDQPEHRCIWASEIPTRLFEFDKYGFGITSDQIWKSPRISDSRLKIFNICKEADAAVFFSGNAPIPWHSEFYRDTINRFVSTRLDRLLVPVKIKSKNCDRRGVLQVAEFRDRWSPPIQISNNMSEEERAATLNFICNVSVAI